MQAVPITSDHFGYVKTYLSVRIFDAVMMNYTDFRFFKETNDAGLLEPQERDHDHYGFLSDALTLNGRMLAWSRRRRSVPASKRSRWPERTNTGTDYGTERGRSMFLNIGLTGWITILLVALILWKPSRLPALGRAIRSTMRDFRKNKREEGKEEEPDSDR